MQSLQVASSKEDTFGETRHLYLCTSKEDGADFAVKVPERRAETTFIHLHPKRFCDLFPTLCLPELLQYVKHFLCCHALSASGCVRSLGQNFWPAAIRSSVSFRGIIGLLKSGPVTIRGAIAMVVSRVDTSLLSLVQTVSVADFHGTRNAEIAGSSRVPHRHKLGPVSCRKGAAPFARGLNGAYFMENCTRNLRNWQKSRSFHVDESLPGAFTKKCRATCRGERLNILLFSNLAEADG